MKITIIADMGEIVVRKTVDEVPQNGIEFMKMARHAANEVDDRAHQLGLFK